MNVPLFLQQLETESAANTKKAPTGGSSASEGKDGNGNGAVVSSCFNFTTGPHPGQAERGKRS